MRPRSSRLPAPRRPALGGLPSRCTPLLALLALATACERRAPSDGDGPGDSGLPDTADTASVDTGDTDSGDTGTVPTDEVCGNGVDDDGDPATDCGRLGAYPLADVADATFAEAIDGARFGAQVAAGGDVTGDGRPDVALIAEGLGEVLVLGRPLEDSGPADVDARFAPDVAAEFGDALCLGADLTGDGVGDLVVGERSAGGGGVAGGGVWLLAGPLAGDVAIEDAAAEIGSTVDGDELGSAISCVEDAGARLLVGARGADASDALVDAGEAWMFVGPVDGVLRRSVAAVVLQGEARGDYAGRAVDVRGDFDGDGVPDAVVGAYRSSTRASWAGAVYVVFDPAGTVSLADADVVVRGLAEGEALGRTVHGASDFDGDGLPDLAVGATGHGGALQGAAYVFTALAPGGYVSTDAVAVVTGRDPDDSAGVGLAAGDLDGDGVVDLAVGAPGERESSEPDAPPGWVGVVYGPVLGTWAADDVPLRLEGANDGDAVGVSLSLDEDLDGDRVNDLLIGAYKADVGGAADAGALYTLRGLRN